MKKEDESIDKVDSQAATPRGEPSENLLSYEYRYEINDIPDTRSILYYYMFARIFPCPKAHPHTLPCLNPAALSSHSSEPTTPNQTSPIVRKLTPLLIIITLQPRPTKAKSVRPTRQTNFLTYLGTLPYLFFFLAALQWWHLAS